MGVDIGGGLGQERASSSVEGSTPGGGIEVEDCLEIGAMIGDKEASGGREKGSLSSVIERGRESFSTGSGLASSGSIVMCEELIESLKEKMTVLTIGGEDNKCWWISFFVTGGNDGVEEPDKEALGWIWVASGSSLYGVETTDSVVVFFAEIEMVVEDNEDGFELSIEEGSIELLIVLLDKEEETEWRFLWFFTEKKKKTYGCVYEIERDRGTDFGFVAWGVEISSDALAPGRGEREEEEGW